MNDAPDKAALPTIYTFAWTPPEGGSLGSIILSRRPAKRLTRDSYWYALGQRINRMIAAEDEEDVLAILRTVERMEPLLSTSDIKAVGSSIAIWSEWLHNKVHFPPQGIPADELEHEPETLEDLLSNEYGFGAYINDLYCGAG